VENRLIWRAVTESSAVVRGPVVGAVRAVTSAVVADALSN
jgi:hypothetical protein